MFEKLDPMVLFLVPVLLCIIVSAGMSADTRYLVNKGKSDYSIVFSGNASVSEQYAAEELSRFIYESTGVKIPVKKLDYDFKMPCIAVGQDAAAVIGAETAKFAESDESFIIKTSGPNLVIAGGKKRGTIYGVYTFLENVVGCRWYTQYVSKIPKHKSIKLPDLSISEKPDFEYRSVQFSDTWDKDWAVRNKMNGASSAADKPRGGVITYGRFGHSFYELVPAHIYYKEHPEYYSLVDGKRLEGDQGQLCLSNPEVVKIGTQTVLRWIEENPNADIWSISQNDNERYCTCDKCSAIAAEEGAQSGVILRFVNAIADEVAKKHPDVLIDTLAYVYSQAPPKITKPAPNVCIRLCVFDCVYHPYEGCEPNAPFMKRLHDWGQICKRVYIWQYTTVFTDYLLPLPEISKISADIPMYERNGVKGVFSLGSHTAGYGPAGCGGFMDNLKAYMLIKLFWDTKADAKAIVKDFVEGFYGSSAKPVQKYLNLLEKRVENKNIHGWCATRDIFDADALMTPEIMAESEKLFDQAEQMADSPEVLARVKHARLSIDYVKVMRQVTKAIREGSAEDKSKAAETLKEFVGRCTADGIAQLREGEPIAATLDRLNKELSK